MKPWGRVVFVLAVAGAALPAARPAWAGFGIFKTHVVLPRVRPPAMPLRADSVALEVEAGGPEIEGDFLDLVRERLESALEAGGLYRLVGPREADARVSVTLERLRAEVRDELRDEHQRVKVGERREWNEKKKRYETKDVYADRRVPVSWRVAEGRLAGEVRVATRGGDDDERHPLSVSYAHDYKKEDGVPLEARNEDELRRFLVAAVADQAVGVVAFGPEPVEVLLATNGPLKPGNERLRDGYPEEALASFTALRLRGDDEAARRHNLGVAHEALAYRLPPFTPEHREHLDEARRLYEDARRLDPGEKYFAPPLERIEISLSFAAEAARLYEDITRLREQHRSSGGRGARRDGTDPAPPRDEREPADPREPREPREPRTPREPREPREAREPRESIAAGPAPNAVRNGGFESALPPWTTTGSAALVSEEGHGRTLELGTAAATASAAQPLTFTLAPDAPTHLRLAYRVTRGDAVVRVDLAYDDGQGRARSATLAVSNGEGPGEWSQWSHDLGTLRPRPARLTRLGVSVSGGTLRLDDVSLSAQP